jgi:predicted dehydrogenase
VHVRCLRTKEYYRADKWRGTWSQEGGAVLINQAIHFLDQLLWLTGGARAVSGAYANLTHGDAMETEDTVAASLRLRCGALATLEATCSSHLAWEPTVEIHGTDGSLELRGSQVLKVLFTDSELTRRTAERLAAAIDQRKLEVGKRHYGSAHPEQVADFVSAIRDRRAPFVTAESAAHTASVVFAVYESHREGRWVDVAEA